MRDDVFKPLKTELAPLPSGKRKYSHPSAVWVPRGQMFLKGPIPLFWLNQACALGYAALAVGLECWLLAGLNRSPSFRLNLSRLKAAPEMARSSARRGLRQLEDAGLVTTARPAGQRVLVAIKVGEAPDPEASRPQATRTSTDPSLASRDGLLLKRGPRGEVPGD